MTFDPSNSLDPQKTDPDLRTEQVSAPRSAPVGTWLAVIAAIVVAAFAWYQWGGMSSTDPNPTASTTPSISEPAPKPVMPVAPPTAAPAQQ
ncbi:hypothetical protein [Rhizobium sp. Root1220]|uniref:hypothetical protein n=1 Tax=Rhizobium sp. Root1220 TaxID=1736432 RepID=UPI0006F3F255|nr:hypothetical protein [Rhizobium sp. Root1220]KQV83604.1 hypothetical protein ASC90_20155 [Rhizobium sp. Root1220]